MTVQKKGKNILSHFLFSHICNSTEWDIRKGCRWRKIRFTPIVLSWRVWHHQLCCAKVVLVDCKYPCCTTAVILFIYLYQRWRLGGIENYKLILLPLHIFLKLCLNVLFHSFAVLIYHRESETQKKTLYVKVFIFLTGTGYSTYCTVGSLVWTCIEYRSRW